jgi:hypothetical protein
MTPRQLERLDTQLTHEALLEARVQQYAAMLLVDAEGNSKVATADHALKGAEPGFTTAQARFYEADGAYYIDEYRDEGEKPIFRTYMEPSPRYEPTDPLCYKWDVGMVRLKWKHFSEGGHDVAPFLHVLEEYFGSLPSDGQLLEGPREHGRRDRRWSVRIGALAVSLRGGTRETTGRD